MARSPFRSMMGLVGRIAQSVAGTTRSVFNTLSEAVTQAVTLTQGQVTENQAALDQIASWANSQAAASDAFMSAAPGDSIGPSMISTRYPTIDLQAFNAAPAYRAKVEYTVQGDSAVYSLWQAGISIEGQTVGSLTGILTTNLIGQITGTGPTAGSGAALDQVTGITLVADAAPVA